MFGHSPKRRGVDKHFIKAKFGHVSNVKRKEFAFVALDQLHCFKIIYMCQNIKTTAYQPTFNKIINFFD